MTVSWPRIGFKRATQGGLARVTEAMFPACLFACFELAKMHRQVRCAFGISGIVRFGDRYPRIEDGALAQLRGHRGVAELKELIYEFLDVDQTTTVQDAFTGALVKQVLPATASNNLMDFLGRKMEAQVEHSRILPEVTHPPDV